MGAGGYEGEGEEDEEAENKRERERESEREIAHERKSSRGYYMLKYVSVLLKSVINMFRRCLNLYHGIDYSAV